jgi:hypothetical protein
MRDTGQRATYFGEIFFGYQPPPAFRQISPMAILEIRECKNERKCSLPPHFPSAEDSAPEISLENPARPLIP